MRTTGGPWPATPTAVLASLPLLFAGGCGPSASPGSATAEAEPTEACALDHVYEFGWSGSLALQSDRVRIEPPDTLRVIRSFLSEAEEASCSTQIPACAAPDRVDVGDVRAALGHPDVAAAWSDGEPVLFGRDLRPVDVPVWWIRRDPDSDRAADILLGDPCRGEGSSCTDIPDGLRELHEVLAELSAQAREAPTCRNLGA